MALGISPPQCSPPPLIRLYYTYSRGGGEAPTASPDRLLPKSHRAKIPSSPFYSMTQYFGNFSWEFRRYGERRSECVALYDGPSHISISELQ